MSGPIVLSTWSFGVIANRAAWPIIGAGGDALDAVVAGAEAVELDESVHSVGLGGLPDRAGRVSLDASVMLDPSRSGAVCFVRRYAEAARLARAVMDLTMHKLLAGDGAEALAERIGLEARELLTAAAAERYERWKRANPAAGADTVAPWRPQANIEEEAFGLDPNESHDTVGVLALDRGGRLAGACTTSGMAFKTPGRVGDSPIIGHGLYVHPEHGAAVATGTGELASGVCATMLTVERMRCGDTPAAAAEAVIRRVAEAFDIRPEHQLAVIALSPAGTWSSAALRPGFSVAAAGAAGERSCIDPAFIALA